MAKFCTGCGAPLNDWDGFCRQCGTMVTSAVSEQAPADGAATSQQPNPQAQNPPYQQAPNPPYQQAPQQPMNPQGGYYYPPNGTPYASPYGAPPYVYAKPKIPGRGFGIASMVLGIIGIVYAFFLFFGVVGIASGSTDLSVYEESYTVESYEELREEVLETMIPSLCVFAVLPLLAIIFGIVAKSMKYRRGSSTAGLVLGILGMAFFIGSFIVIFTA